MSHHQRPKLLRPQGPCTSPHQPAVHPYYPLFQCGRQKCFSRWHLGCLRSISQPHPGLGEVLCLHFCFCPFHCRASSQLNLSCPVSPEATCCFPLFCSCCLPLQPFPVLIPSDYIPTDGPCYLPLSSWHPDPLVVSPLLNHVHIILRPHFTIHSQVIITVIVPVSITLTLNTRNVLNHFWNLLFVFFKTGFLCVVFGAVLDFTTA